MPTFISNEQNYTIIGDFSINSDIIDLSNLKDIGDFSYIKVVQSECSDNGANFTCSLIDISDTKKIILLGVEESQVDQNIFNF